MKKILVLGGGFGGLTAITKLKRYAGKLFDVTLIDKSLFRKDLVVADTVYNPEKTKMILEAEEAGCQAIGGKGMLLYQGVVNYSLFTGKDFPIEEYQKFQAEQAK